MWGAAAGYGAATLTVTPKTEDGDGPALTLMSDAMFVRIEQEYSSSTAGGSLTGTQGDVKGPHR